jgi:hypothetical protein
VNVGIFSKLFGKAEQKTVIAHILDPDTGYTMETWVVGRDVFPPENADIKNTKEIYVVNGRKNGEVKSTICSKQMWLAAKAAYAGIDAVAAKADAERKNLFTNYD